MSRNNVYKACKGPCRDVFDRAKEISRSVANKGPSLVVQFDQQILVLKRM